MEKGEIMKLLKTLNKKLKKYLKGFSSEQIERLDLTYSFDKELFYVGFKSDGGELGINTYDHLVIKSDPFEGINQIRKKIGLKLIK